MSASQRLACGRICIRKTRIRCQSPISLGPCAQRKYRRVKSMCRCQLMSKFGHFFENLIKFLKFILDHGRFFSHLLSDFPLKSEIPNFELFFFSFSHFNSNFSSFQSGFQRFRPPKCKSIEWKAFTCVLRAIPKSAVQLSPGNKKNPPTPKKPKSKTITKVMKIEQKNDNKNIWM